MANKVTIDVEARFIDNVSGDAKAAAKSFDDVEKNAREAKKEVDKLGKAKAKPKADADISSLLKKVRAAEDKLSKLGRTKTEAKLGALDKASQVIHKVTSKAKAFGGKTYSAIMKIRDSNVLSSLNNMSSKLKSITGKAWSAVVKIKDTFTAPLTKLKNMLFNIRTLIAGIATAWAATKLVVNPINLADQYSSAKIGFSTLLGEAGGQKMMDDLDEFAKRTPFKTSGVIANAQKMMAMGWDTENLLGDLEVIGNAAAATGKLDQGLESIVRAMSQIKTKGKLSTEELNQLAEAGIAAKAMLAEGLGYGTGDEGIAKMTEDLEKGAISSNKAIEALLVGMRKYDGMMDSMANETVEGLWSQIQDVFEINVFRKWGQGLQDGAKRGFGTMTQLLDKAQGALSKLGDMLYEIGKMASNWVADKFQRLVDKIMEITGTFEFQKADLGGKISLLWNGIVADPLKEWWENGGQQKTAETAGRIGSWMGEMLTKGLLALFGATDILNGEGTDAGANVAGSFLQGFLDKFDGKAITQAFADAIGNVWNVLPWEMKVLLGLYGGGRLAGGIAHFAGGITKFFGSSGTTKDGVTTGASGLLGLIGKTGQYGIGGSGILGGLSKLGYSASGATARMLGSTTGQAKLLGVTGGTAALAGAGAVTTGVGVVKSGVDYYQAYNANKRGDYIERDANIASGTSTLAGAGIGAAIGTAILPGVGTLIGAGLGTVVGWFAGDTIANNIRAAKYESEEMKEAIKDSEKSSEELAAIFEKAKWENAKKHFGDIALSMAEIESLADSLIWGEDMAHFEKFTSATQAAASALENMKAATEQTDRWMWKAALGIKFSEDEIEGVRQSFSDYIASAKSFVENKHYEFTASVSLLVDPGTTKGKNIIASGDAFFGKIQEQLNDLGGKLSDTVEIALKDGVITLDEHKEIINLQQQIAEITEKVANAEQKAELDLVRVKFGSGNLDADSFDNFMAQMQSTIDERMNASDTAFVASVSALNLQLEDGAITKDEYDKQLQAIVDGYTATVEELQATVRNVELEIVAEAYKDVLGADAAKDLSRALESAFLQGVDPIDISDEDMAELLNIKLDGNSETISNLKEYLSEILGHLKVMEVDGKLLYEVNEVQTEESITEIIDSEIPSWVNEEIDVKLTSTADYVDTIDIIASEFGIEDSYAETVRFELTGAKTIEDKISVLCEEFGIEQTEAEDILWKLSGLKEITNSITPTAEEFGIQWSYNYQTKVNVTATEGTITPLQIMPSRLAVIADSAPAGNSNKTKTINGRSRKGSGATTSTNPRGRMARGGIVDNSGIVGGSTRFIRVNEESPEMIIPLSSQRRERALKLWTQTGEMLDVPGFARGGNTDGGQDEGIRFHGYDQNDAAGGRSVQVEVGGIKVDIHVDAAGTDNIADAIRAQANEIAETVAGIMADAIGAQFDNTPVRGGAA